MMAKAQGKGLREYNAEIKALEEKLKTLDKNTGEYSRTKSRIDVLKNVVKRFKTPAREALLAGAKDAGAASAEATEAPKVGRGTKGRPAKFAKYAPIIDPKTGRVNIGQARYLSEKGVITKKELAQYEKLALTRNARRLPEAERGPSMRGEARYATPRPGVTVTGPEDKPAEVVEKKPKPKPSTKGNEPKNKPSGRTRASYKIIDSAGKVNINAAKRAYDDGVIDKGELQEYKKRALSQNRSKTKRPAQLTKAQEAAANARDRAADIRDLANERDRAADLKEAKEAARQNVRYATEKARSRAAQVRIRAEVPVSKRDTIAKPKASKDVLKKRAEAAAKRTAKETGRARTERLGKSAVPESVSKVKQVLNQPSVRTALKITGKLANKAMIAGMIYDTIKDPSMGKKDMDAWIKRNPDATMGEIVVASAKNAFGMDLGKSKAIAKAEVAKRAGRMIPADRGDAARRDRTYREGRRADQSDRKAPVVRLPQPGRKVAQNGSVGRTGATGGSYTVKSGDNLWDIAQRNKTTVSALLKANPTIAQRRKAGKVDIYSGSKVRIPGKK